MLRYFSFVMFLCICSGNLCWLYGKLIMVFYSQMFRYQSEILYLIPILVMLNIFLTVSSLSLNIALKWLSYEHFPHIFPYAGQSSFLNRCIFPQYLHFISFLWWFSCFFLFLVKLMSVSLLHNLSFWSLHKSSAR